MPRTHGDPATYDALVDVALNVVARDGLGGASMRTIAAAAGVTTGSLTHHFASKDELLTAVILRNNVISGQRVSSALGCRPGIEGLVAAVEQLLPLDAARRRTWAVWIAFWGVAEGGIAKALRSGNAELLRLFVDALAEAARRGEIDAGADLVFEAQRLSVIAGGLGLHSGATRQAHLARTARRMITAHFDMLRTDVPTHEGTQR